MTDNRETGQQTFRVQLGQHVEYIAADYMINDPESGMVQLCDNGSDWPVAVIALHPAMSVVRVSNLITKESTPS